jgi:hypothetical protein
VVAVVAAIAVAVAPFEKGGQGDSLLLAHHRKKQIPRAMKASSNIEPTQRAAPFFKGGELTRLFEIAAVAVPPFEKGGLGGFALACPSP